MERDYHATAPEVAVINSTMWRYDTDALVHSWHFASVIESYQLHVVLLPKNQFIQSLCLFVVLGRPNCWTNTPVAVDMGRRGAHVTSL